MKRIIGLSCAVALLLTTLISGAYAAVFSDVSEDDWFYASVKYAADNGIVAGRGDGSFDPDGTLTTAEGIKLAVGLHVNKSSAELPEVVEGKWYDKYLDYAVINGIIEEYPENPDAEITRAQFAEMVYASTGELTVKNSIADGGLRDVADSGYTEAVYALYRAGVLTGSDKFGRFYPERTLTRAEACEIIMRALVPTARKFVNLPDSLEPEDVFELCSDAVFSIETFYENGKSIRTGSGFFISSDGLAATNLHVLENAHSAKITTTDGEVYELSGVAAYDADMNAAIIQVEGTGFTWLPVTASADARVGQDIYSIGNPLGLDGTISKGIISFVGRESGGRVFLQFTASISQGSGGGALVDARGYAIGITSSSFTGGSSLNLATPSDYITTLREAMTGDLTALTDIIHAESY